MNPVVSKFTTPQSFQVQRSNRCNFCNHKDLQDKMRGWTEQVRKRFRRIIRKCSPPRVIRPKRQQRCAHSSAEFPHQMYDFWRPNLNLICLWRMIHVGAKREQALNQINLNAGPAKRIQSCALWVVSRLMRAAGISSEMETGGDAYDSISHRQHQHFLWCTLNKSYGTMRARSFVAMVIEGFFFSVVSWTLPTRGTSLGETIAAGAENVELMNSHQEHSGSW